MELLKCDKCGNIKRFYRNISVSAKLRVNNKGEDLKTVYDINKDDCDNYFEPIYCCECGTQVGE
ncbi:hypothetical protein LXJ15735_27670 [Lacrimispora xylanolytica]